MLCERLPLDRVERKTVREVIDGEHLNGGPVPPGVGRQSGFQTGLSEKCLSVPAKLRGHLGKKQSMPPPLADMKAVAADLDRERVGDRLERGEDGDLQLEFGQFLAGDRWKTGVLGRGGDGAVGHSLGQGTNSMDISDAAAKHPGVSKRDEGRSWGLKARVGSRRLGCRIPADMGANGVAGNRE